jgi:FlaA1/EpsC-like NDP-sugar epimerase
LINIWKNIRKHSKFWLMVIDILSVIATAYGWLLIRFDIFNIPVIYANLTLSYIIPDILITILVFHFFKLYHSVWSFASLDEVIAIFLSLLVNTSIQIFYKEFILLQTVGHVPWSYYLVFSMLMFLFASFSRMSPRLLRRFINRTADISDKRNTLVVGAGAAAYMLINELRVNANTQNRIVCIVDDNPHKIGKNMLGVPIFGNRQQISDLVHKYKIEEIIIAIPSAGPDVLNGLVEICYQTNCRVRKLPIIANIVQGNIADSIQDVSFEDLLSRKPVDPEHSGLEVKFRGKRVLVTGGGGSIGSELCIQIAANKPAQLLIFEINENSAYRLQLDLKKKYIDLDVRVLIGSVRDLKRLEYVFNTYRPELVYHAAAHKHVPLMEYAPGEAIKNNCKGTLNLCQVADKYNVQDFLLISTDKAVNPTNIMGASKRIAEMILQYYAHRSQTRFVAVRFGNVLGSDGSVVPLFLKQIEEGGPVTVTHEEITRYFMTIPEAVSLILETALLAKGGEIFILDMGKQVKIYDMAEKLIRMKGLRPGVDIEIEISGLRPGEKLYEELLMDEEGIQKTENDLIYVGQPIEFDEENLLNKLEELFLAATENRPDIKERASLLCGTYVITNNQNAEKEVQNG